MQTIKTIQSLTNRGFTGHEHLPAYGIINMNGRVYDPVLARFLSPDNFIQAPNNTQSFNRYSYVLNNPLKYTDPTGWNETDFLNEDTGETMHVEDGKEQITVLCNSDYRRVEEISQMETWNEATTEEYFSYADSGAQTLDSDLGILSRLVYSEMEGGNDNAKAIVAESVMNRTEMKIGSHPNPDGTITGAINKKGAYDVTNPKSDRYDEFTNPYPSANTRSSRMNAWLGSIKAAYNAMNGSDVGKGTTSYNSNSATYYDKKSGYEKINLNITHTGIKGTWKLKF